MLNIPSGQNCKFPDNPEHGKWACRELDAPMNFPITERSSWKCESSTARKSKLLFKSRFQFLIIFFQPCNVASYAIQALCQTSLLSSSALGADISRSIQPCSSASLPWPCLSLTLGREKYFQLENQPIVTSC